MPELDIYIDPEIVGKNIRRIRKSKDITIIELAKTLGYATGKLSNIENGKRGKKRGKFPYEELVEIAKALNEPIEEFLVDNSDTYLGELEKLKQAISFAKHKLSAGLFQGLNETLEELQQRAEKIPNKSILSHLHFIWAEYYRDMLDYETAKDYYRETIKSDSSDREIVELKMRSYNGLASLFVKERKLFEAINVLRDALNFSERNPNVLSLDLSNVHFNLAIIYLHIGSLDLAEYHIQCCLEITQNKNEQAYYHATYLLSITYWIQGRNKKARSLLIESMNWFQRQKDLGSLYNSLELIFFLHRVRPNLLFPDIFSDLKEFLDVKVPASIIPQKIRCFYRLIEIEIHNENYDEAKKMIEKCKQHVEKYNIKEGFRVYSLEAYLINKTSGDKRAEQKALEKALDYFTFEDRSAEKANLLYRLGKLTSTEGNRLFEEALRIYEEIYYEKNYLEGSLLTILPQLRY